MAPTTPDRHRFGDAGGVTLLEGLLRTASSGGPDIEMARTRCAPGELLERADRLAERLIGGAPVAVRASATLDTVIALVACLRSGSPLVPIADDSGADERAHIIGDSRAVAILGEHGWGDVDLPVVTEGAGACAPDHDAAPLNASLVVYTSGTTGPPKGVLLPETAIAACLDGLRDAWAWTPEDRLVHGLPLFHVHGLVLGVIGALRVGCALVHTGRPTPQSYAAAQGSLYFGVPTVWSRLVADTSSAEQLRSARLLVSGSAPLPVAVFEGLGSLTGSFPVERYGMTETLITISTRADGERRPGHVGLALPGVETRLRADDGGIITPDGETIGELEVRGVTVGGGYLGRPEVTAANTTSDGWFMTGDSAVIGADGFHRIVGRTSLDVIESGGYKVGAGEVETVIAAQPGVEEVAVVGVPDDDLGERIVAFVVGDADSNDIIDRVAEQLSVHKRPREVRRIDALPRNALGKVQKTLLRGS